MAPPHSDPPQTNHAWRARLYRRLEPQAWPEEGLSPLNRLICLLIFLSVVVAVLETEPVLRDGWERLFLMAAAFSEAMQKNRHRPDR